MKTILAAVCAALFLFGFAGHATASFFDYGNLHMVLTEEADNATPVSSSGTEMHYDLGPLPNFLNTNISNLDTDITLSDFSISSWDDIYVGIYGVDFFGTFPLNKRYFTSAHPDYTYNTAQDAAFTAGTSNTAYQLPEDPGNNPKAIQKDDTVLSYRTNMQQSGDLPGSYGGPVTVVGEAFNAELRLSAQGEGKTILYGGDWLSDLDDGQFPYVGTFNFSLDPADDSVVVNYSVPIPATVLLFGSGLLGLFGIRRRKNAQ
jgi:hypothetical protein